MINMTYIECYSFSSFMRILSFVSMSIIIILNLNPQHQLSSLSRLVYLNLYQSVKHFRHFALRINTYVRFFYLTTLFRINMHAHHHSLKFWFLHQYLETWHHICRHSSYFESHRISSRNCRNWTEFIRSMRNSRNTDNNFDFKLRIFFNKCKRVELSSHAYMKKTSFMFAKRALFHFYNNQYENITFNKFRVNMKKFFEEWKWKRFNLTKWQFMHIDNVIAVNSNLFLTECLQKLFIDFDDV
jgi:hypothetical protein